MHAASAEGREYAPDERELTSETERLVSEHGEEADNVAAQRADASFREGDMLGGTRWLRIFRRIAMAHRRRAAG